MGSATNAVALQVGGALGVAVIGSVASTRYQNQMMVHWRADTSRRMSPSPFWAHWAAPGCGSCRVGGATGALLAGAARAAFMSGLGVSFLVGAVVALGGVLIVLIYLPSSASDASSDRDGHD